MSAARSGNAVTTVVALLLAAVGVAGVLAGGADDSPGLQLLGALLVLAAVLLVVRVRRRR